MGYRRSVLGEGRCYYCRAVTDLACDSCAHFVCVRCHERHEAEWEHRTYGG